MENRVVKCCPGCGTQFSVDRIVSDPKVEILGMSVDHDNLRYNFYYFNHTVFGCGSTFVIHVEEFKDLLDEPLPKAVHLKSGSCENHCLTLNDDTECSLDCRWAPFRRLLIRLIRAKQIGDGHLAPITSDLDPISKKSQTA